jgi:hypothetical protein
MRGPCNDPYGKEWNALPRESLTLKEIEERLRRMEDELRKERKRDEKKRKTYEFLNAWSIKNGFGVV